jgi:hypothetical protein
MTMVQATDDDAADNVRPIRPDVTPEPQPRRERPKDHRAAARKAKSRSKNKADRDAGAARATPVYAPPIAPTVTQADVEDAALPARAAAPRWRNAPASQRPAEHHRIDRLTLLAALALAAVSAGFSIYGFTSIFVGAFLPVIGMGVALEFGKLRAVTWIGRNGPAPWWRLKGALTVLVLVLMGLNVVGAFGFLAKAHIAAQVMVEAAGATSKAGIEGNIGTKKAEITNLTTQIAQIDAAVSKTTERGRTNAAMQLAAEQRRFRAELSTNLAKANTELAALNVQKATADGAQKVAEADLGPVRYLATLLGANDQDVLRWFIAVVAMLLDPAAVLLLLAATRRR